MTLAAAVSAFVGVKEASDQKETMTDITPLHWVRIYRKSAGDLGALCNGGSYRPVVWKALRADSHGCTK